MSVAEAFHQFASRPENLDLSVLTRSKDKLSGILKGLTDSLKVGQNRETLPSYVFPDMLAILARLSHSMFAKLKDDKKTNDKIIFLVEITTECFRSLRNACAGCKRNQEEVLRTPGLYRVTAGIITTLVTTFKGSIKSGEVVQCLRCAVQFLGNAAAGFDESKALVWEAIFSSLRPLLVAEDATLANYTCMLIYTCLTQNNLSDLMTTKEGAEVVTGVLNHFAKSETEWGLYILEKLLANKSFLTKGYKFFTEKDKSLLLGFIHKKLQVLEDKDGRNGQAKDAQNELRVDNSNVGFISDEFKKNSAIILNLGKSEKDYQKPESQAVVNMLWSLISATLSSQYREQLQNDTELLKVSTNLLHSMTMIGKQGENAFSPASKLSQESSTDKSNPVYGLKRDVIRLIGNLVYKHRANQDKIREMGGVPVIMENTSIDAKNPFIQQWAIFAIRNLCENNVENQELVGSTKLEALADNPQLNELGVDASIQNDKITLKSVKR